MAAARLNVGSRGAPVTGRARAEKCTGGSSADDHAPTIQPAGVELQSRVAENGETAIFELKNNGQPAALPGPARLAACSVFQDLGEIPSDCLVPAGAGGYQLREESRRWTRDVWLETSHEGGAFKCNE